VYEALAGPKRLHWTRGGQTDFYDQPTQVDEVVAEAIKHFRSVLCAELADALGLLPVPLGEHQMDRDGGGDALRAALPGAVGKEMAAISKLEGLMALQNPVYVQLWSRYAASGLLMILGLSALPIVSTVKPWMKHDKAHSTRLAKAADAQ
jgi:hypothetical protein